MSTGDSGVRTPLSLLVRLRREPEDQGTWSAFVALYGPQIYAWCRRWRLQPADAEDVTQAVLLKLAKYLRTFDYDPNRRFRALLKTITHNAWSDFLDGRRRAVAGSGDSAVQAALCTVEARDDLVAQLEATFDHELLALAQDEVRQRVEPRTWEAFRLTALEGLSGADVAAQLGMRRGAVFQAKSKVQQMLRDQIERLEREESSCPTAPAATTFSDS